MNLLEEFSKKTVDNPPKMCIIKTIRRFSCALCLKVVSVVIIFPARERVPRGCEEEEGWGRTMLPSYVLFLYAVGI